MTTSLTDTPSMADTLAAALLDLANHADDASTQGRFADGIGGELDALDNARTALAAYEAAPEPQTYSLGDIRHGTGFAAGTRFVAVQS